MLKDVIDELDQSEQRALLVLGTTNPALPHRALSQNSYEYGGGSTREQVAGSETCCWTCLLNWGLFTKLGLVY